MIRYECDKCGRRLADGDRQRYIVKVEIFAAAEQLDLDSEKYGDASAELAAVLDELATANPDDIEDRTYRSFRFDLCDACRKTVLARPLG